MCVLTGVESFEFSSAHCAEGRGKRLAERDGVVQGRVRTAVERVITFSVRYLGHVLGARHRLTAVSQSHTTSQCVCVCVFVSG